MLSAIKKQAIFKALSIAVMMAAAGLAQPVFAARTDGCLPLAECQAKQGTSQGQSFCGSNAVYCLQYDTTIEYTPPQNTGGYTANPCADQLKGGACVSKETDCSASPVTGAITLCPTGMFCCVPVPKPAAAASSSSVVTVSLPDPLSGANLPQIIGNIIRTFAGIAGAIALLMFVYGGIMWILSGGESAKVAAAQKILMNATIGLILIFGAYFFTSAIVQGILANPQTIP